MGRVQQASHSGPQDLRARRMERGLTAAQLAHAAGVPVWAVLAWERGKSVSQKVRARAAAYLLAHRIPAEHSDGKG